MQYRPLSKSLDLFIHLTSKHQTEHFEITKERPNRMPKCGGDVSFHKEMTVPGEAIANQGHEEHTPPIEKDGVKQEEDASKRAHEMPTPGGWF